MQASASSSRLPKRHFRYLDGLYCQREEEAGANSAREETTEVVGKSSSKRNKVARACIFCKRSHVSCEEARPCSRCIARGIGEHCCDSEQSIASENTINNYIEDINGQRKRTFSSTFDGTRLSRQSVGCIPLNENTEVVRPQCMDHNHCNTSEGPSRPFQFNHRHSSSPPVSLHPTDHRASPNVHEQDERETLDSMLSFLGSLDPTNQCSFEDIPLAKTQCNDNPTCPEQASSHDLALYGATSLDTQVTRPPNLDSSMPIKPTIAGELPEYNTQEHTLSKPWQHIMNPSFSTYENPEDSTVRPYQYAYGYSRMERWMNSGLSGYSKESVERVKAVLDYVRPLLRSRWKDLSDIQLVQHEERFLAILDHYRKNVIEAVPAPMIVIRRTCEIISANQSFAKLCNVDSHVFTSGRLCLYQLLSEHSMVEIFEKYAEIVYDNKQSAIQNFAEIHFTSAPKNSTSTATNVRQMQKTVVISMEPIFDEYGLPICLVCTFTPVDVTMSTLLSKRREQSD